VRNAGIVDNVHSLLDKLYEERSLVKEFIKKLEIIFSSKEFLSNKGGAIKNKIAEIIQCLDSSW
jgi:hypothetical protein